MSAINQIAKYYADDIREGIAWVIVWKTGRSWHASTVWLNPNTDTFEIDDLSTARRVLEEDPNAIMVNGYHCGHFGEDMTVAELADGIRWHYKNGCNKLENSTAFPPERMERPADIPEDIPWYDIEATAEDPDPYVFDGHMSPEDYERRHELIELDRLECVGEINNILPDVNGKYERTATLLKDTEFSWITTVSPEAYKSLKEITIMACKAIKGFYDTLLLCATAPPKWWYLYKRAKKARTRKKWGNRLLRQLLKDVEAINAGEVIT